MFQAENLKPYKISFEQRDGYLYALVEGDHDSYEISRAFWQEIADMAAKLNADRVLIEEDIVESVSLPDVFRLASEIPEMGFGRARIAFVDRYLEQEDINGFGELVAINRGANGHIFNDIKTAQEWLTSR